MKRSRKTPTVPPGGGVALSAKGLAWWFALLLPVSADAFPVEPKTRGRQEFQPGLWIDWQSKSVEIAAKVVLRSGPLELLMCSARTKEHESILVAKPRPLHIMQALGLAGFEPGSPPRYDFEKERMILPTGQPLEVRVRYREGELTYTVPPEYWMREVKSGRPPELLPWVFSGSRSFPDGRFAADVDGTIVTVVDFETALISVGDLHSADNDALWLEANTEAIPALNTECVLIVRSAKDAPKPLRVSIQPDGELRLGEIRVSLDQLAARLREASPDTASSILLVDITSGVATEKLQAIVKALADQGIDSRRIELRPEKRTRPAEKPAAPAEP